MFFLSILTLIFRINWWFLLVQFFVHPRKSAHPIVQFIFCSNFILCRRPTGTSYTRCKEASQLNCSANSSLSIQAVVMGSPVRETKSELFGCSQEKFRAECVYFNLFFASRFSVTVALFEPLFFATTRYKAHYHKRL